MDDLDLTQFQDRPVGDLPFGIQKRVEFARALAAEPKLLLLDEPAAGLNHEELSELARLIRDARDRLGITVLLVEHHMSLVMSVSDHIVALNFGKTITCSRRCGSGRRNPWISSRNSNASTRKVVPCLSGCDRQ
jgi:branched-chain amino acid transport system ATP-binding protein